MGGDDIGDVSMLVFRPTPEMPVALLSVFTACMDALHRKATSAVPGCARIVLVLPGMSRPSATSRYLAGRNSPRGEIVSDGDGNTQLVAFGCLDVTAWMTARGFLTAAVNGVPVTRPDPEEGATDAPS